MANVKTLKYHKDNEDEPWKCNVCDKMLSSKKILRNHMDAFHAKKGKTVTCTKCEMMFATTENMYKHIRYIHMNTEAGKWVCKLCDKEFSTQGSLYIHNKVHEGIRYHCPICENSYTAKANLQKHLQKHNNTQKFAQCTICGNKVLDYTLKSRVKMCSSEKQYKFYYCDFKSKILSNLSKHENTHKEFSMPSCDISNKQFVRDVLKYHRLTHYENNFEVSCSMCSYKAKHAVNLKKHMAKVHKSY